MTETKEDIQAQIDQLGSDWEQGLDSHKVRVKGAMALPTQECSSFEGFWSLVVCPIIGFLLILLFVFADISYEDRWVSVDTLADLIPLIVVIVVEVHFVLDWRRVKRTNLYFEHLRAYKSKRAKLQAELDALD